MFLLGHAGSRLRSYHRAEWSVSGQGWWHQGASCHQEHTYRYRIWSHSVSWHRC